MKSPFDKLISVSALIAMSGYVLSGPIAFFLVHLINPQPPWVSPSVFSDNYSPVQDLPYYFGFLLIGGMLMLVAGHYLNCQRENEKKKFQLLIAFGWTIVFCALITFNYVSQTTFVRNLALHYKPEYDAAISAFSMANPMSFCWANEMWGYALLGVATWFMAGYYRDKSNFIRILLILNGIISVASALWTAIDVAWVMTTAGLVGYFAWNVLMIVLMISIYLNSKNREQNT
jgi:hypothetical protein